ncbi:MAG: hydantoinase/oxoprolinase family protein [Ruminococcaceae bacterium]|nr:hydantoinase/oxoprolinase family protein [Oscillospiraceae bacterium]
MKLTIGIDTGGTFTDAVIYDKEQNAILCNAKALTTRDDLKKGILNALKALDASLFPHVDTVALSTTLATNACVEHKSDRVKLIMLGTDRALVAKIGKEYGLPNINEIITTDWGLASDGTAGETDIDSLIAEAKLYATDTDAFAVTAQWGMKNPAFERDIAKLIESETGVRTICSDELSKMINVMKRAATVYLNAGLIRISDEFFTAVKQGLSQLGIKANIVIVRGDGGLMSEEYAAIHPVETLFSGPAASVCAGVRLSSNENCIFADMGGTTTDMSIARNGMAGLCTEGLSLGGYRTCTKAVDSHTVALGGDSHIRCDENGKLTVGPSRVLPLSYIAHRFPQTASVLSEAVTSDFSDIVHSSYFLFAVKKGYDSFDSEKEKLIYELACDVPRSVSQLAKDTHLTCFDIRHISKRLLSLGILIGCAMTPTDIMHCMGIYSPWSTDAANCGAELLARQLLTDKETAVQKAFNAVCDRLYCAIGTVLIKDAYSSLKLDERTILAILNATLTPHSDISLGLSTKLTLVGLGAPSHVFIPPVAKMLGCDYICPTHADVACAVGACCGNVTATSEMTVTPIEPGTESGYRCHGIGEPMTFDSYEQAIAYSKERARSAAISAIEEMGGTREDVNVFFDINENTPMIRLGSGDRHIPMLIEARIKATAITKNMKFAQQ